jgi:hypothetical protein
MKRNRAAFTIVQNEPFFLPKWLDYYGRHFAFADLYVLDHDTTDGSSRLAARAWPQVVFFPVHRAESFNHEWLCQTVQAFQVMLLQSYENVLFTEADEFVVADPRRYSGLGQYIERLTVPVVKCVGINVFQTPVEKQLDFGMAWLQQRSQCYQAAQYSKPLLSKVPLRWVVGFHSLADGTLSPPQDPNLLLFHCHRIDYEACHQRHRSTASRNWSRRDLAIDSGRQNRIVEPAEFRQWYYGDRDLGEALMQIPDALKVF